MTDTSFVPLSLAEGLYGPDGPINGGPTDPRARAVIDSGIARPAAETEPEPRRALFAGADKEARPTAPPSPPAGEIFDAAKFEVPEGFTADPATLGEFANAA